MNIQCVRFAAALLVAMALALPSGVLAERRVRTTPLTLVDASGTTMGVFYPSFIQWGYQDIDTQTTSVVVLDLGLSVGPVALPVAPTGETDTRDLTWAPTMHSVWFDQPGCVGTAYLAPVTQSAPGLAFNAIVPVAGGGWTLYATTRVVDTTYHDIWSTIGVDGICRNREFAGHWTLPPADVVLPLTFAPPFRAR